MEAYRILAEKLLMRPFKKQELELQRSLRGKRSGIWKIRERNWEGEENVLRRDDQKRNENRRVLEMEYGRDNKNQGRIR